MNYPRITLDYQREILQELIKDMKVKISERRSRKRFEEKFSNILKEAEAEKRQTINEKIVDVVVTDEK